MLLKSTFTNIIGNQLNNSKTDGVVSSLPNNLNEMQNLIIYGPSGVGKYTEVLKIINKYSISKLLYEKKILINATKGEHTIKISDIHYEIDIENLTCNAKILFNDIYNHICDVIESSPNKKGIILCKNFHQIDYELLDFFYSYMQNNINSNICIKYILISEHYSFIPNNIIDISKVIYYSKLSQTNYEKIANTNNKKLIKKNPEILKQISCINTLKHINLEDNINILDLKKSLCNIIIKIIVENNIDYNRIRNLTYNILIYNLNIYDCMQYIVFELLKKYEIGNDKIFEILLKTGEFFKYYNNNYRPIYHLEAYILYLIKIFNENK